MKVLVINEFTRSIGGTDQVVRLHIEQLKRIGINVDLFSFNNNNFDELDVFSKIKLFQKCITGKLLLQ